MVAAAVGAAAVVGGATQMITGSKAAKAQKKGADHAVAEQRREYDQDRADLAPYRETGTAALGKLASMYGITPSGAITGTAGGGTGYVDDGGYSASPGYAFQLQQGTQAAERSAAARGQLASGGTMKAIARYTTGLAANDYDQYASRIAQLAGVGQQATNATVAAGQQTTNQIAQAQQNAGNARASSYANIGSAINGTINNLASAYLYSGAGGGFGGSSGTAPTYGGNLGGIY